MNSSVNLEIYRRYREISIMDNYNCKMQACVRVCEENNKELEEKTTPTETICG